MKIKVLCNAPEMGELPDDVMSEMQRIAELPGFARLWERATLDLMDGKNVEFNRGVIHALRYLLNATATEVARVSWWEKAEWFIWCDRMG